MDDALKNKFIIVLVILTVACLALAVNSAITAHKYNAMAQRETALRIDKEEKLTDVSTRFSYIENELQRAKQALKAELDAHGETKKKLTKTLEDYEKLNMLKIQLENDLKEVLYRRPPDIGAQ